MKQAHTHLDAERFQALLDGDLPDREALALRAEVEACPRCHAEFEAWRELFHDLEDLPLLVPSSAFRGRVLDQLPVREERKVLAGLFGRRDARSHATSAELQDHLDGRLAARSAARLEEHLGRCATCRTEMDGLHQVVRRLDALPMLAPPTGFSEGVMAGFRIQQMAAMAMAPTSRRGRVMAWLRARKPSSSRGWAAALGLGTAPVVTFALALQAVFSHELVTFGNLFSFLAFKLGGLTAPLRSLLDSLVADNALASSALDVLARVGTSAPLMAGVAVAVLGTCLAASWVLYRNLVFPHGEEGRYAQASH